MAKPTIDTIVDAIRGDEFESVELTRNGMALHFEDSSLWVSVLIGEDPTEEDDWSDIAEGQDLTEVDIRAAVTNFYKPNETTLIMK